MLPSLVVVIESSESCFNPDELRLPLFVWEQNTSPYVWTWTIGKPGELLAQKLVDWTVGKLAFWRAILTAFAFRAVLCDLSLAADARFLRNGGHVEARADLSEVELRVSKTNK